MAKTKPPTVKSSVVRLSNAETSLIQMLRHRCPSSNARTTVAAAITGVIYCFDASGRGTSQLKTQIRLLRQAQIALDTAAPRPLSPASTRT